MKRNLIIGGYLVIILALVGVSVGWAQSGSSPTSAGLTASASIHSGTYEMVPGTNVTDTCAYGLLPNSAVTAEAETVNCSGTPTTTTTTAPPTTTTTTSPANCPGGKTTGEDYATGGTLGPFTDTTNINNSNGFNTYVAADGFWANPADSNVICVNTASNWTDTVNFGVGNPPQVQGYPDTQQLYATPPTTLTSTFNITDPSDSNGTWEAAYDVWTNNYKSDVMVWEDTSTARAAGSFGGATVDNSNVTIDGVSYTLVHFGTEAQPERMLIAHTNVTSGSVNITDILNWLIANSYLPAGDGVNQSDFGWEVLQTSGAQTFTVNSYTLTSS